jgi:hypothetical protein
MFYLHVQILALMFSAAALFGCEQNQSQRSASRNTDSQSFIIEEIIETLPAGGDLEISIGNTTVRISKDSTEVDTQVQLRRIRNLYGRDDEEALVLSRGDETVEVRMVTTTGRILGRTELLKELAISQRIRGQSDDPAMIISIPSAINGDEGDYSEGELFAIRVPELWFGYDPSTGETSTRAQIYESIAVFSTIIDSSQLPVGIRPYVSGFVGEPPTPTPTPDPDGGFSLLDCSNLAGGVWIPVPANPDVGQTEDFCVMKYEAKLHNGTAIVTDGNFNNALDYKSPGSANARSVPEGRPWVGVKRQRLRYPEDTSDPLNEEFLDAERACSNLSAVDSTHTYTLITNAMWQTIARNIETAQTAGTYLNWDGDPALATTALNRGHSNGSVSLAASSEDSLGCFGIGSSTTGSIEIRNNCRLTSDLASGEVWHLNKRTHTLSNGQVIWDFSGNVWQWVLDNNNTFQGTAGYIYQALWSGDGTQAKWGPTNSYYDPETIPERLWRPWWWPWCWLVARVFGGGHPWWLLGPRR